jgi:hypothetical protein
MRILVVIVAAIALSTVSGHAQQNNPNTPWTSLPAMKDEPSNHADEHSKAPKADDKAYRSALDGIPQIKDRDPWGNVRAAPKSKSSR